MGGKWAICWYDSRIRRCGAGIPVPFYGISAENTRNTGVRIFNGAVRTEREFPLKILSLACIQGVIVLLFCGTEFIISSSGLRIRFCFALYPDVFRCIPNHSSR